MTLNFSDLVLRLCVAMVCGGIIGFNRGRKNRPAGMRTHMIICMGAALTIILGIYFAQMAQGKWIGEAVNITDVTRLGAQVINGIGFIGVGTVIITGKQQVKGLTTAAGLWACACMGLSIGAGFYVAALVGCLSIIITVSFFSFLESKMFANSRYVTLYIEFDRIDCISSVLDVLNKKNVEIRDVDISKASEEINSDRAVLTLKLPKKMLHEEVITAVAQKADIRSIEEL